MSELTLQPGSLVLYKNRPARIAHAGETLEIELEVGKTQKVRPKDITLLHPGPLASLRDLQPQSGDLETAWELLAGETTTLEELAELIYGTYTPPTAWATWQLIAEGVYFRGTVTEVAVRSQADVEQERLTRETRAAEEQAWTAFLERVQAGQVAPEDKRYLREVEDLAWGQRTTSRVLRELGYSQSPERAQAFLYRVKYWDHTVDPYPQRLGVATSSPTLDLPDVPKEPRVDLTHLPAFAIDDEGNEDPDDALSLEGSRLWVHVADVAALIGPGSAADLEARARGCSLYLPEGTVTMLPPKATRLLGMGLTAISPALSFGVDLDTTGTILAVEVLRSWVRVTRLTYAEVETRLDEPLFQELYQLAQVSQERRRAGGALFLNFPELKMQVVNGQVSLQPLPALQSRDLVAEAMLLAGEAAARFALARGIPLPFTTQDPPETHEQPTSLSEMFALRRTLKRSQQSSVPARHAGLGLDVYTRATSPLRRYLDLVVHQQLRAYLRGTTLLGEQEILERVGAAEAVTGHVRLAERLARKHWALVYLSQHPGWHGEGILVDKRGLRGIILIPALDLEVQMHLHTDLPLDSIVPLTLSGLSLPDLEVHFQIGNVST